MSFHHLTRRCAGSAALAAVLTAGAAGVADAEVQMPTPVTVSNAVLTTVGGCQTDVPQLIRTCTNAQTLSNHQPLLLTVNPVGTNIVVLGAGLFPDGSMRPVLVKRLQAARALALAYPTAPVIVTGGVPRSGRTEAQAMFDWLTRNGVAADRITQEGTSTSTVQNATHTNRILAERGATGAAVVTSPNHLRRALVDFRDAVGGRIPVAGAVSAG